AEAARVGTTSLPIVVNLELFREFLSSVTRELARRAGAPAWLPVRDQLVVRASSIGKVPAAEAAVGQLLQDRGLYRECNEQNGRSFCVRLPERNNFRSALQEQKRSVVVARSSSACCSYSSSSARPGFRSKLSLADGGTMEFCRRSDSHRGRSWSIMDCSSPSS